MTYFEKLFQGRINRRSFFICFCLLYVILVTGVAIFYSIKDTSLILDILVISLWIGWVVSWGIISFSLMVKRLHDIGLPGPWSLLFVLPVVNIIFLLGLIFYPGKKTVTKFGKQPKIFDLQALFGLSP